MMEFDLLEHFNDSRYSNMVLGIQKKGENVYTPLYLHKIVIAECDGLHMHNQQWQLLFIPDEYSFETIYACMRWFYGAQLGCSGAIWVDYVRFAQYIQSRLLLAALYKMYNPAELIIAAANHTVKYSPPMTDLLIDDICTRGFDVAVEPFCDISAETFRQILCMLSQHRMLSIAIICQCRVESLWQQYLCSVSGGSFTQNELNILGRLSIFGYAGRLLITDVPIQGALERAIAYAKK